MTGMEAMLQIKFISDANSGALMQEKKYKLIWYWKGKSRIFQVVGKFWQLMQYAHMISGVDLFISEILMATYTSWSK
jgi:hypothetical protein